MVTDTHTTTTVVIKLWGPREKRDPRSLFSYEHGDSLMNLGTPQLYNAWSNVGMINILLLTMVTIQSIQEWLHLHLSLYTGQPVHLYTENIQQLSIEASAERCEEI